MRAWVQRRYGELGDLRCVDWPIPRPGPREVAIRVHAAGVDPGIWHTMTGRPYMVRLIGLGFFGPRSPVAGWDAAGVVTEVGAEVTRFRVGDAVLGNAGIPGTGTFAEHACLPEARCVRMPSGLGFDEAAALTISGCTALEAVRDVGDVSAGSRVLVLGASGGVGHFAVQLAKARGAHVTGVCSDRKRDFVRSLGADEVLDRARASLGDHAWDLIVDTGGRRPIGTLARSLAPKGALAIVGGEGGNAWTGGFVERSLAAAVRSFFTRRRLRMIDVRVRTADLEALCTLVGEKKIVPRIDRRFAFDDAVRALECLQGGHVRGKLVVTVA